MRGNAILCGVAVLGTATAWTASLDVTYPNAADRRTAPEPEIGHRISFVPPAPESWLRATGDNCTDPLPVSVPADLPYTDANQHTCGRLNNYSATCLGNYDGGEDILYQLNVTADTCLNVTVRSNNGQNWFGVGVGLECPPAVCIGSGFSSSATTASIQNLSLEAGTYHLIIDTWPAPDCLSDFTLTISPCPIGGACCDGDTGDCLDVENAAACAAVYVHGNYQGDGTECATTICPMPPVDCANPTPVVNAFHVPDDSTCGRRNDYDNTCLGAYDGGEDVIYEWTVTADGCYEVFLDPKGTAWTGVALDEVCPLPAGAADCLFKSTSSGGAAHGFRAELSAGTYYIMVDTYPPPDCIPSFDLTATPCATHGACCKTDGTCEELTEPACLADPEYYSFAGLGTDCASTLCTGACCRYDGFCTDESQMNCQAAGGFWHGLGTECATTTCPSAPVDCSNATPVTDAFSVVDDTTCGRGDFYRDTCLDHYDSGEDMIYEWAVTADGCYDVLLNPKGTTYTGMALDHVCPLNAGTDACLYKSASGFFGGPHGFRASLAAGSYYIMIDTWASPDCIPAFDLTATPCPIGACCAGGTCSILDEPACDAIGGLYLGADTECGPDCDNDGNPDACELALGAPDCQPNGIPDACDVAPGGGSLDCQPNGVPDECEMGDPVVYFHESFEGAFPPAGWENTALEDNGPWVVSTNLDYVRTGARSAIHGYSTYYDADSYLVTPELTLNGGTLSVWSIGCFDQDWCDSYDVEVWFVVGDIGGGDDVYLGNLNDLWEDYFTTWKEFTYDLSTVADGSPFRIGFRYVGYDGDLGVIDDVVIRPSGAGLWTNDCNRNNVPDDCDAGGDMNGDGMVDIADYPAFEACLAGPAAAMSICCGLADMDDDNDCDLDDFASFQRAFQEEEGPGAR